MEEIDERTARSMIADRDAALKRKEKRIAELESSLKVAKREIKNRSKLNAEERGHKEMFADYMETVDLMVTRMPGRKPLVDLRLFDVVRNALDALDMTRRERDRYEKALAIMRNAANEAGDVANRKP